MEIIDSLEKSRSGILPFAHICSATSVEFSLTSILLSKLKGPV